jgi:hypothetical protein
MESYKIATNLKGIKEECSVRKLPTYAKSLEAKRSTTTLLIYTEALGLIKTSNEEQSPLAMPQSASKDFAYVESVSHLTFLFNPFQAPCSFCTPSPSSHALSSNPHLLPIAFQLVHVQT